MKKITLALAAHVDAGKTTLAEALLHKAGLLRLPGRVDQGNTVMDAHETERRRGITIFAGEAAFEWAGTEISLLDTPGHVDFSPEAERALLAADAGLLIISGLDGIQAHTRALWQLMKNKGLPVLIFVSKMDSGRRTQAELLKEIRKEWGDACLTWRDLTAGGEEAALLDEALLEAFLAGHAPDLGELISLIRRRLAFPVFFGSGLKEEGLEPLLTALGELAQEYEAQEQEAFRGLVYKIDFDEKGARQSHVKVLAGRVRARDEIQSGSEAEKVSFIRRYTGARFQQTEALAAGSIGVLMGLKNTAPGSWLGLGESSGERFFEPIMRYSLSLPPGMDADAAFIELRPLCEEDPSLNLHFGPAKSGLFVDLMGPVQQEILEERIREKCGWEVHIEEGRILYRETISAPVEGVGHYEPLRHYAEVHLALRPLPRGKGLSLKNETDPRDVRPELAQIVLKLLSAQSPRGVLTGAPLADVEIALLGVKDHEKHTEGGDLKEAAFRALRQGLMQSAARGEAKLLEPMQAFQIRLPQDKLGRALSDIKARAGDALQTGVEEDMALLEGRVPAASFRGYERELAAYTGGRGRLMIWQDGYDICHNPEQVIAAADYDPLSDREDPCDSVFCEHGAGFSVPWHQVPDYMHLPWLMKQENKQAAEAAPLQGGKLRQTKDPRASEAELEAIMLREFGPIKRPVISGVSHGPAPSDSHFDPVQLESARLYLVDGYNLIFTWEELKELADRGIENAREQLIRRLQNFAAFRDKQIVLVFDGYRVGGNPGEMQELPHLTLAYTKEHETADMFIERRLAERGEKEFLGVVSNDNLIRLAAIRLGARRIRCEEFIHEYEEAMASLKEKTDGESRIGSRIQW